MLVVSGANVAEPVSAPTWRQRSASTCSASVRGGRSDEPAAAAIQAHAMRQGSRIACVPPGIRTGHRWPTRSNPARSPTSSSPPQMVPSVP